jgi:hypothetical protein
LVGYNDSTSGPGIALTFYSTGVSTSPPGPGAQFTLQPGETLEKTIAELDLTTMEFFNIQNASPINGSWEIQIGAEHKAI